MLPMPTMILRLMRIGRRKKSSPISGEHAVLGRRCQGRHHISLCLEGEVMTMVSVYGRGKGIPNG